ncbi:MAG: hypothetical protein JWO60_1856, partial [Frankiales bacterium]|nr:hypothetical protein [Frankiales bacterium]
MIGLLLAASLYGDPQLLGRLPLDEVSGVAVGARGVWVQEDSGNGPVVVRVDRRGRVLQRYDVRAQNRDWEDLAAAPDAQGRPSLWLADVGDNRAVREQVQVHRVAEGDPAGRVTTSRFTYEDGPHDAEALLVLPGAQRLALVTKGIGGAGVYEAPVGGGVLRRVATVRLSPTGTPGGPVGAFGQLLVTGGAVSADGTRVALRTYTDLYEWDLQGDLAATFAQDPARTALPPTGQGEAVAYDGPDAVLVASEGQDAPLQRLVRQAASSPSPSPSAAPTPTAASPAPGPRRGP